MASEWSFVFPRVMKQLAYTPDYYDGAICVDGQSLLERYWDPQSGMTAAAKYEVHVHSPENNLSPDRLTETNRSNANNLGARGIPRAVLHESFGLDSTTLPTNADVFLSNKYDNVAAKLFADLCMLRFVKAARATKLLYQKRPCLFPILDWRARCALDVPYERGTAHKDYLRLFHNALRHVRDIGNRNVKTLDYLARVSPHLTKCPGVPCGFSLSRVRIIDILAWMLFEQGGTLTTFGKQCVRPEDRWSMSNI